MAVHRIRWTGSPGDAVAVVTTLADADGIDLTSSRPPAALGPDAVELLVEVEGDGADVRRAVAAIHADLSTGATIEIVGG